MARGKYHEWITEDGLLKLEGWARSGLTDEQIAKNMGIAAGTLYEYKKRYPEIDESLKKGKAPVDIEVENALLKNALGYEYEETETIVTIAEDGTKTQRVKKIKRYAQPDTSAAIFWLKNRKPEEWRNTSQAYKDKTEAETAKLIAETAKAEMETERIRKEGITEQSTEDRLAEYLEQLNGVYKNENS